MWSATIRERRVLCDNQAMFALSNLGLGLALASNRPASHRSVPSTRVTSNRSLSITALLRWYRSIPIIRVTLVNHANGNIANELCVPPLTSCKSTNKRLETARHVPRKHKTYICTPIIHDHETSTAHP